MLIIPSRRLAMRSHLAVLLVLGATLAFAGGAGAPKRDARLDGNLAIVFDASGSMQGQPMTTAKKSLEQFMKTIPVDWNAGVIVFDKQGVRELLPMGKYSADEIAKAIAPIKAGGGTPLGAAIGQARGVINERRQAQQNYGRYRMLVVTDGEASDRPEMAAATTRVLSDGTELMVIGFRIKGSHSLRKVATDYRDANDGAALSRALEAALAETDTADESFRFEPIFGAAAAK